jgi:hypothetical protein
MRREETNKMSTPVKIRIMSHFMYIKTRKNFNTEYMRLGMDFKIIPSYVLIDIYISANPNQRKFMLISRKTILKGQYHKKYRVVKE